MELNLRKGSLVLERGRFLALDIGGTNFRVLLVTIENGEVSMKSNVYMTPDSVMVGPGVDVSNAGCNLNHCYSPLIILLHVS